VGATIELRGVNKTYETAPGIETTALVNIDLSIEPGSALAVTGPSGSGKSTLLYVIGAMERADSGSVTVDGTDLATLPTKRLTEYRRTIGFIFQQFYLLPALNAVDNVAAPVLPYRTSYDKVDRAMQLLDEVGLADRAMSLPSRLSGGQQQRVAIARSLINSPRLLLADEPTGNLDSAAGSEVVQLLLRLRKERGMTVIVATHDFSVASRCDRMLGLRDGAIVDDVRLTPDDPTSILKRVGGLDPRG